VPERTVVFNYQVTEHFGKVVCVVTALKKFRQDYWYTGSAVHCFFGERIRKSI